MFNLSIFGACTNELVHYLVRVFQFHIMVVLVSLPLFLTAMSVTLFCTCRYIFFSLPIIESSKLLQRTDFFLKTMHKQLQGQHNWPFPNVLNALLFTLPACNTLQSEVTDNSSKLSTTNGLKMQSVYTYLCVELNS